MLISFSLEKIPRIVESPAWCVHNILKNYKIICHGGGTIVYSCQPWVRVSVLPHPYQQLVKSTFLTFNDSNGSAIISYCAFSLHFLNDWCSWLVLYKYWLFTCQLRWSIASNVLSLISVHVFFICHGFKLYTRCMIWKYFLLIHGLSSFS